MKTPELKPCPFCGGEATIEDNAGEYPMFDEYGEFADSAFNEADSFWVECDRCHTICGISLSEAEAVSAWNRRVTDGQMQ